MLLVTPARCLMCGWLPEDGRDPLAQAQAHTFATAHPTISRSAQGNPAAPD
jgi:hypothetical protein